MGRFLIVLGIILIIIGGLAPFLGMQQFLEPVLNVATNISAQEAELCKAGETLREVSGGSTYTPGSGYGRSVRYFCVNASGEEREVTGEFASSMISDIMGTVFGASPFLLTMGLSFCGFPVLLLGILLTVRGRVRSGQAQIRVNGVPVSMGSMPQASASTQLTARLQQLEQAYQAKLISREEYERMRQEIMNNPF